MSEIKQALRDIDSRTLFAPYFRARWQNMQNIVNDSTFYDLIPEPYLTYYRAYIKQWLEWSTGFVPMLHRGDFFATGMGYTVCDIFARECMSGGFRLDARDETTTKFISAWGDKVGLRDILSQMFFFSNAGGNALLVLTPHEEELNVSVMPINRVLFEIGRDKTVSQCVLFNRFIGGAKKIYYAREQRIMLDGIPYYKVDLALSTGLATVPNWNTNFVNSVPFQIETLWRNSYGEIEPGVWYRMPRSFKTIGVYNVRNKAVAAALTDLPGYSDSTLNTATDLLYSIDYNYTCQQIDMYWGRTRVEIPPQMTSRVISNNTVNVVEGTTFVETIRSAPLSEEVYHEIKNGDAIDGKPIQPTFIQPDLRAESHKYIRDADLELLASKVGLSSTTLANHLSFNTDKTATQVRSEQDTTEKNVNDKRDRANEAINTLLQDVARFYGYSDDVNITWNRAGVNTTTENAELLADYQAGTMTLSEYLRKRWRDLSESEIDARVAELQEQEAKRRMEFGEPNPDTEFKDVTVDYV